MHRNTQLPRIHFNKKGKNPTFWQVNLKVEATFFPHVVTCTQVFSTLEPTPRQGFLQFWASHSPRLRDDLTTGKDRETKRIIILKCLCDQCTSRQGVKVPIVLSDPTPLYAHADDSNSFPTAWTLQDASVNLLNRLPPSTPPVPALHLPGKQLCSLQAFNRDGNKMQMPSFPACEHLSEAW